MDDWLVVNFFESSSCWQCRIWCYRQRVKSDGHDLQLRGWMPESILKGKLSALPNLDKCAIKNRLLDVLVLGGWLLKNQGLKSLQQHFKCHGG